MIRDHGRTGFVTEPRATRSSGLAGRALFALVTAITLGFFALDTSAQEKSVRPGINDSFEDAEVERFIERFERNGREIYDRRFDILNALELKPGVAVADIGAGTGFFAKMFSEKVGEKGKVYAVEIEQNFLDHIDEMAEKAGIENIVTVLGEPRTPKLEPNSVDVVFICDTYHHFEYPFDMLRVIHAALREGGRLVIVDFERVKGVTSDFSIGHVRCGKGTVTDEVKDSGFTFEREYPFMKEQYLITFRKRPHTFDD